MLGRYGYIAEELKKSENKVRLFKTPIVECK